MKITKIHTSGSDYLFCDEDVTEAKELARRLLDRRFGIGADGLIIVSGTEENEVRMKMFLPDGKECFFGSTAVISAAKFMYDKVKSRKRFVIRFGDVKYNVRLSVMGGRVLCAWLEMPPFIPKPMEQLKYYYGIRGEVLRACIPHPRVSVYELCGAHAVFMLESAAALRALNMPSVCKRLEEVLFYGENIDLHFAAISGDNVLALRSWRCRKGETFALGEGAVLSAYAAAEYEIVDSTRVIVKTASGNFCVELNKNRASLCAKCETVFCCEAI